MAPPTHMLRASSLSRGFTLLEVLMALVVFALAAAVLGAAYVNVLNSYEAAARGMTQNADYAFARQIVLTEPDRNKLEEGGEFQNTKGETLRWEVEITSTTLPDLFQVAFTCEPTNAPSRGDKTVQTFLVLRPTWSIDAAERTKLLEETRTRILELQGKKQ